MGKSKPKIKVTKFYMTLHIALAFKVKHVLGFEVGDKIAWEGDVQENEIVTIRQPELFGGLKREGGVELDMHVLMGETTQELSTFLAGKLGRTFTNCPGFHDVTTIFLTEISGAFPGAYLQANSPSLPAMKWHVARPPAEAWYPAKAACGEVEGAAPQLEIATFGTQEQMTNEFEGTTGSTTDYWDDVSFFYNYGGFHDYTTMEAVYNRYNARQFNDITPPHLDPRHAASNISEYVYNSWHWSHLKTDGSTGQFAAPYPANPPGGLVHGLGSNLGPLSAHRPGDPDNMYVCVDEFWNFDHQIITRFVRTNGEWIANPDHSQAVGADNHIDGLYMKGFDDNGDLVIYGDNTDAGQLNVDFIRIHSRTPPFNLLNTGFGSGEGFPDNGTGGVNLAVPSWLQDPPFYQRIPNNKMMFIQTNTNPGNYAQDNESLCYTLDLGTGQVQFINFWGATGGPYSEPNVTNGGGGSTDAFWQGILYDPWNDKIIFIWSIPGEFWHASDRLYREYVYATCNGDLTGYQYHGVFPWSGMRDADDERAASAAAAVFVRQSCRSMWESQRHMHTEQFGPGAQMMQVAWSARLMDVVSSVITAPQNQGGDTLFQGEIFIADMANSGSVVASLSDRSTPQPLSTWDTFAPLEQGIYTLTGSGPGTSGIDHDTDKFYDPTANVLSGYSFDNQANFQETGSTNGDAGPPVLWFNTTEIRPIFFLNMSGAPSCSPINPIHAIYDIMTDEEWGMGTPVSSIDDAAFRAAADTTHDEGYCISYIWLKQLPVGEMINEIIDHIEATLYVDPSTGLWTIKLIRGDYDINTLREVSNHNCELFDYRRKALGETVNFLTVSYTKDDGTEEAATVSIMEPGNIAAQNNVVPDDRNFYMFRSPEVAMIAARRELRSLSYPLATMRLELDHEFWDIVPGGVLKLSNFRFPDGDTIEQMALRIIDVDRAHRPDAQGQSIDVISANVVEDIFALPDAEFQVPDGTTDVSNAADPTPLDFVQIITLPYMWTLSEISAEALDGADEDADVFDGILGASLNNDTSEFDVLSEQPNSLGVLEFQSIGTNSITSRATLTTALVQEAESTIADFDNRTRGPGPQVGTFLVFGDGLDADQEIAIISDISGGFTVKRGVLDTTPKDWPVDTPVWIVDLESDIIQDEAYPFGSLVRYQLLSITSRGTLASGAAPIETETLVDRPRRPLRPANVVADGVAFGQLDARSITPSISVTVSERDRLAETSVVQFWDAATVTPEPGTTISLQAWNAARDTLLGQVTGLTGVGPHLIPVSNWGAETTGYLRVISVRAGVESFQGHEIEVLFSVQGEGAVTLPVPLLAGTGVN